VGLRSSREVEANSSFVKTEGKYARRCGNSFLLIRRRWSSRDFLGVSVRFWTDGNMCCAWH